MESSKSWNPTTKRVFAYNGGMMNKNHKSPISDTKSLMAMRHSCEHILTMAMLRIWGNKIKAAMGPATDEGFYFDFDSDIKISEEDFPKIENEMTKIIKEDLPIIKDEMSVKEAQKFFSKNIYKGNCLCRGSSCERNK